MKKQDKILLKKYIEQYDFAKIYGFYMELYTPKTKFEKLMVKWHLEHTPEVRVQKSIDKVMRRQIYAQEIRLEKGLLRFCMVKSVAAVKAAVIKGLAVVAAMVAVLQATAGIINTGFQNDVAHARQNTHKKEFSLYDEGIGKFVKQIKALNLTKLELLMEVPRKLYEEGFDNKGFAYDPEIAGRIDFRAMQLAALEGGGVCRNIAVIAQDAYEQLGIETEFKVVYMNEATGKVELADVARTFRLPETTISDESGLSEVTQELNKALIGNHAILKVKELPVTLQDGSTMILRDLYIDPTNPSLLVKERGTNNLVSLNAGNLGDFVYNQTWLLDNTTELQTPLGAIKQLGDILFGGLSQDQIEQLQQVLGKEAQDKALTNVREAITRLQRRRSTQLNRSSVQKFKSIRVK